MENSDLAELENNFKERKIVYDYDDLYDHELDYDEWLGQECYWKNQTGETP